MKLYGMKDVPDLMVEQVTEKGKLYFYSTSLKTFTHFLIKDKDSIKSQVTITDSLISNEAFELVQKGTRQNNPSLFNLYFDAPNKNKESGEWDDFLFVIKNAKLENFKFGLASNGDPSQYVFQFIGDVIEVISKEKYLKLYNQIK